MSSLNTEKELALTLCLVSEEGSHRFFKAVEGRHQRWMKLVEARGGGICLGYPLDIIFNDLLRWISTSPAPACRTPRNRPPSAATRREETSV